MTDATTAGRNASQNGHGELPPDALSGDAGQGPGSGGLPGRLVRALAGLVQTRIPPADLDDRDPDYIRENLPGLWLLASLWFRAEVRGLANIPEDVLEGYPQ